MKTFHGMAVAFALACVPTLALAQQCPQDDGYGDSVDAQGKVVARAWCEAVVQRLPEYVNAADEPHLKQADPALSAQSKQFGRKIQIISFRWVNPSEI